jgi:16S rRNA (cytosine967-C5)-methyltransferase
VSRSDGRAGRADAGVAPARAAAWRALLRVSAGARLDDTSGALPELEGLADLDRALANELVLGTVKRRLALDAVLDEYAKAPVARADAPLRESLRLGAYQLLFLDRVPAYAVVSDAVALVAPQGRRAQGFLNAVLRKVAHGGRDRLADLAAGDGTRAWSVRHSCPPWLVRVLRAELGDEAAGGFLRAADGAPERCLRVNGPAAAQEDAARALAAGGFTTSGVVGLPDALVYDGPPLERSSAFRDGLVTPQSRGSQVAGVVAASAAGPGAAVLDLCAAPGTKTAQLAALLPDAAITAVDVDGGRVEAMRANLARQRVRSVDLVVGDALDLPAAFAGAFDTVLLDAPCSGLGTLGTRPDVRWRRREADIGRLAALQRRLLASAAGCVRPGGTLTYAVCTFPRAETVDVVGSLLEAGGWAADDLGAAWPAMRHPAAGGSLLVVPPDGGSTGFFIARARRTGAPAG